MSFNTPDFILLFLPMTLVLFHRVPPKLRFSVILISSLLFYIFYGWLSVFFLSGISIWSYLVTYLLERNGRLWTVSLAVSIPVFFLFGLKGASTRYHFFPLFRQFVPFAAAIPAGISLSTLRLLSYLIDVWAERIPRERNFLKLLGFAFFFPIAGAGPVVRFGKIRDAFNGLVQKQITYQDYARAFKFISIGLLGKTLFSDLFIAYLSPLRWPDRFGSMDALLAIFATTMKIYFDFWGYSLIAFGVSILFFVPIPKNFDEPFLSLNPVEFWRRWNVTLAFWFRDYVFSPLAAKLPYSVALLLTFTGMGIWHQPSRMFILWGLYQGLAILAYQKFKATWDRMPKLLQTGFTFSLFSLSTPLFIGDMGLYKSLITFDSLGVFRAFTIEHWLVSIAVGLVAFFFNEKKWLYGREQWWEVSALLPALVAIGCLLFSNYASRFMYVRF